jgi:DNA-binding NtrC family response regulator
MQLATTLGTDDSPLSRLQQFRLRVAHGRDAGREAVAEGHELLVGTAPENHLTLTDPTVSRHHLVVRCSERGYWVRDLGSTNGIRIDTHRVEVAAVTHGSELAIGATRLVFELLDEDLAEPAAERAWGALLGTSPAMRRLFAMVPRISRSGASVLIEGETGTGKTTLARALHAASSRAHRPFVVVDCNAIPPALIESMLFGARSGALETAQGGTVFLDEISQLPLDLQPRVLRVLESRESSHAGGPPSALDVRIIAATNRDLRALVERGAFRGDLYYRLAVVALQIPPLRARREDIPGLVAHFYRELGDGKRAPDALVRAFAQMDWPGNVRELRNAVERAVLLGDLGVGELLDLPAAHEPAGSTDRRAVFSDDFDPALSFRDAKERATARWERWYVGQLLRHTRGNLSEAARVAHSDRGYLRKLVRKYTG